MKCISTNNYINKYEYIENNKIGKTIYEYI